MYKIKVDSHVHSILTNHAYSTIEENAIHAKKNGIKAIAITDHFGLLVEEKQNIHYIVSSIVNRKILPKKMHGVYIIKGVEMDIIDHNGNLPFANVPYLLDKDKSILEAVNSHCDIVIASVHPTEHIIPRLASEHTHMYIKALQNPLVNIIGHMGRSAVLYNIKYDIQEILKAARDNNKAIEINGESLKNSEATRACIKIAEKCAEENVYITIGSDAHCAYSIGDFTNVYKLLKEIHFPKKLILNTDCKKFADFFKFKL